MSLSITPRPGSAAASDRSGIAPALFDTARSIMLTSVVPWLRQTVVNAVPLLIVLTIVLTIWQVAADRPTSGSAAAAASARRPSARTAVRRSASARSG